MAAPRKYGPEVRDAIHELVNDADKPATEAADILARRFEEIPTLDRIREIAREEKKNRRPTLSHQSKDAQLQRLIAGIVNAVDRALQAAETDPTSIDGDELLKLARTVREIEPLLKPEPQNNSHDQAPKGLLGTIGASTQPRQRNPEPTPTQPVRSAVAGVDAVNMGAEAA